MKITKMFVLYIIIATLFSFVLRAGGQIPVYQYHLTFGPEIVTDEILGHEFFVYVDIDTTVTPSSVTSIVYRDDFDFVTYGSQLTIRHLNPASYDPYTILSIGNEILSISPGVFTVSYSGFWLGPSGVFGGNYLSNFQAARDIGVIFIGGARGVDTLLLPIQNSSLVWRPSTLRKR
jgi:hypothetical protein